MSEENVELVRSIFRPGDPSRFFDLLDEEVEQDATAMQHIDSGAYLRGKDDVIEFYRHWWGTWDEYVMEPVEFIDAGEDRVVVVTDETGRGRESGAPFEIRRATIFTLRAGKIAKLQMFSTREQALEAAGLSGVGDVGAERRQIRGRAGSSTSPIRA